MARTPFRVLLLSLGLAALSALGCRSPYHSDQGAVLGGLLGTGTGAIIGGATGHPLAGAAIGAGVGAVSGAAIGNGMDEVEAKNRAMIAQQLGRQVKADAVSVEDVVSMTKAGVSEELILNHVRAHGSATTLQPADLIRLQQEGVSTQVISAMQSTPPRAPTAVVVRESAPPPVIVEAYPGYWGPHPHYYHCPHY